MREGKKSEGGGGGFNTPPPDRIGLMNMYINQLIQVKWYNMIYKTYTISIGARQGGCTSPTLFSIYLDKLLSMLRAAKQKSLYERVLLC